VKGLLQRGTLVATASRSEFEAAVAAPGAQFPIH